MRNSWKDKPSTIYIYIFINLYDISFSGMAALDSRASGKMGMRAVVYYTTTTIIAVVIGIVTVLIIHPGKGSRDEFTKRPKIEQISTADAFLDLIRYPHTHLYTLNNQSHSKSSTLILSTKIRIHNPSFIAPFHTD